MNIEKYDKAFWLRLRDRYFEAQTTEPEERLLRAFAAVTRDADFRELQAVMGYVSAVRRVAAPVPAYRRRVRAAWRCAAAAALIAAVAIPCALRPDSSPTATACIRGVEVTDIDAVERVAQRTIDGMRTEDMASAQLAEIFQGTE